MTDYRISLRVRFLLIATSIGMLSSGLLFAEVSGPELLNSMRQKDQESNYAGYIVSFVATMPSTMPPLYDPNQGLVRIDCEFSYTDRAFAMKKTFNYEHPPVFVPPGSSYYQSFDYDNKGRLIVWRPLKMYILSNDERNDLFEERSVFFVDPNGLVSVGSCGPALHHNLLDIDGLYGKREFWTYWYAMGRGFSRDLGTLKSVNTLSTGLVKVISHGSSGPAMTGTWELTIDADSEHIVRNAVFKMDSLNSPSIVVTTSGTIAKDEIKLAKYGTFRHVGSRFETNIEITNISKMVGPNPLYEEVVSRINRPLPLGAQIVDCRGKKTIITTVE